MKNAVEPWWRRFRVVVAAPVLIALSLAAWAVSSPVGSSPDENYHLNSIWCGAGDRAGLCEPAPSANERMTPAALTNSACFRFQTSVSAECQNLTDQTLTATNRVNVGNGYPPVYYAAMSVFASSNIVRSVLLIRLVNLLLFVLLGAALFRLLPPPRRSTLVLSWAVTIVPLSAFLIASVNPNSWTITGCGTAWLAALGFFETTGRRRVGLGVIAVLAVIMAAGSRADGAAFAALGIVLAAVIALGRRLWRPRLIWLPIVVVALGAAVFVTTGQSIDVLLGVSAAAPGQSAGLGLLFHNLIELPSLWTGAVGTGPLGWLDTQMPGLVAATGVVAFGGLVFYGLRVLDRRKIVLMAVVFACLVVIPLYTLQVSHDPVGENIQPRYLLPLLILLAGLATLPVAGRVVDLRLSHRLVLVVALAASNSAALFANLERYVSPASAGIDLNHNEIWWWSAHVPSPMIVWALGTIVFTGAIASVVLSTPALPLSATPEREAEPVGV